eukprot:MONOS_14602.1-p1 / transcript=MONOS_14602.1 / gene=MONOS_14602 / organism=Monocercomonoides_exilis_PA203 / gene_product=unspecified product / transcript_product=unspecified product / location=Mono_scaffold01033:14636-16768(+) / protein_length=710 / sequence_SO=supercontig / SO=protein_coding / is_pseudo=false
MPNGGHVMKYEKCEHFYLDSCLIDGRYERNKANSNERDKNYACYWNESLISIANCSAEIKDSSFSNSIKGGLTVLGSNVTMIDGKFENNNPQILLYPSIRRNIFCSRNGVLNIESLKGGDGLLHNSSLWILNEGCELLGMPSERQSPFFIPTLEKVESERIEEEISFIMKGTLLLPCNLSFQIITTVDDTDFIVNHQFCDDGFVSEEEVDCTIGISEIPVIPEPAKVSIRILFGDLQFPKHTNAFILKNGSELQMNGEEKVAEGGNSQGLSWSTIVLIVLLFFVLVVAIAFIVRWRKQKKRTEELEVIVEDTVKKDPKAFEMVTMEMSPEDQWRRAEREAEKKNEERIKKRVNEKSLGHSESSEHLLSESGSTEYILGRDSDKIPEWALEKVDDDDETRKRTPSPSISSTSTTDTSDTESTFVRREDLCPTTSSMSNLADAMACSSPHEKLIVDLRDSLFMLLHGRNEKKEMAIGTLQEREYTAVQILFWVANLALHSFDEMDNPLSSLANLSPHIVLFSEHMVICVVMRSDFSSDDSDSSSISSSTVVTSASDDDDDDSLPSSAFEDEDDYKKECLRWKAPELLINKKMGATKESVAFSIGMMLWECLTLKIPFGEYEAEVAGQKIVNGERPNLEAIKKQTLKAIIKGCIAGETAERYSMSALKREFIQLFPPGAVMLTISDAVDYDEPSVQDQTQYRTGPESQSITNP